MIFFQRIRYAFETPWQRTLIIMFLTQVMTALGFSSIFPFLPLYVKDLGSSSGMSVELLSGLVFSSQGFTMMLSSPFWGWVADRYGKKIMVERAMFGGAIVLFLMAFVQSAEQLVLLRTIQGLITGTVAAANALVAATTPREHTGAAMGLLVMGNGAGVAIGPIIGGAISDGYGYGAAFYLTGFLLLLGGLIVSIWIKEPTMVTTQKIARRTTVAGSWKEILTGRGMPVTYSLGFLNQLARSMILPIVPLFIPTLLQGTAYLNTFTGLVTGAAAAATTLSGVYFGKLGDRIGQRKILILSLAGAGLLFLPQGLVTKGWQLLALQALVGIAMGGVVPSIAALLAKYSRPGLEGAVYGLDSAIGSGARSIAPLVGSILAAWFGLRFTISSVGIMLLATSVCAVVWLPRQDRLNQEPDLSPYRSTKPGD